MKYIIVLFSLLFINTARAQQIPSYTADMLVKRMGNKDTTYIVNFWATWCGPCVKELPQFDKLETMYAGKPVKVIMASMDFKDAYPEKLTTYIAKKKLQPEVIWWSETNANEFIPKVDNNWSGALPGTLIVNAANRYHVFIERAVTAQEISKLVTQAARKK